MPVVTINDLPSIPSLGNSDVLPIVGVSTNTTYKVTKQDLLAGVGTVISVGGTGTVNGITLTGTVTTAGQLTLGGTLSNVDLTTQITNILPIANGGTGTSTTFTQGSVVFAGGSGIYSQNNSGLFFDDANVRLGINTASPSETLEVNGKGKIITSLSVGSITPSATTGRIDAANDVVAFSTSDANYKKNVSNIQNALQKVKQINGVEFDWIENIEVHGNSGHDVGVIAQEIERVLPEVVTTRENGVKAVKYEKIVSLLIEAIKDLEKQVEELKTNK